MSLSEVEINTLVNNVETLFHYENQKETIQELIVRRKEILRNLDIIIANSNPIAYYFALRYLVKRLLKDDSALEDISKAIELDPDRPQYYVERGLSILDEEANRKEISLADINNQKVLQKAKETYNKGIIKAQKDFTNALHRDPTLSNVWLGVIACALLRDDWDSAISLCGESEPFISDQAEKSDRAWYLCLALTFAGDIVSIEEKSAIEGPRTTNNFFESMISSVPPLGGMVFSHLVANVFSMNEESIQEKEKIIEILSILLQPAVNVIEKQELFIDDTQNIWIVLDTKAGLLKDLGRYEEELEARLLIRKLIAPPDKWINLSDCYRNLLRFPEALEAAEKALDFSQTFSQAWLAKGRCYEDMAHYQQALNAYSKAAKPNLRDNYSIDLPGKNMWAPSALFQKTSLLIKLNRFHDAVDVLDHLYSLAPNRVEIAQINEIIIKVSAKDKRILSEVLFQKARLLSFKGDNENANICISKAIEINPKIRQKAAKEDLLKDLLSVDVMKPGHTQ